MIAAAQIAPSIEVRKAWPDDQRFVAATFSEQLMRGQPAVSGQKADRVVDRVLDSERTRVLVASDGDRLVGWLAYVEIPRVRALLFTYVRKQYRGQGIAAALASQAWPSGAGQWVHAGLRGGSTKQLLERFSAVEMPLEDLI